MNCLVLRRLLASLVCTFLLAASIAIALHRQAQAETPATAAAVGKQIKDFHLADALGKEYALADLADRKLVVVAFLGTECPLAKLYAPRLQSLAATYADRGVAFVGIMSNVQDSLSGIDAFVREHKLTFPVLRDRRNEVADLFGAERTPQVFVLDAKRKVIYNGRVDDQHLVGVMRSASTRADLQVAIDEALSGKPVSVPTTEVVGCIIGRARKPNEASTVTYAQDIAPILQSRCVSCHRAKEIGPFELTSYEDAAGWGEMIGEVVRDRRMPPWHANPKYGEFANDRSLSTGDREKLLTWVKNGCPAGKLADAPPLKTYVDGWQLPRSPDVVFAMEKTFHVPAEGGRNGVPYQHFRVKTNFTEDKWIAAAEVQPGNRQVVHHTIVYAEPPGGHGRDNWIFLSAYVPGIRYYPLPEKSAKRVPAGSTLVFEMHYTPNGSPQDDQTSIGLLFADTNETTQELVTAEIGNIAFAIPPKTSDHVVTATSRPLKKEVTLVSLSPHMHLRGKAFRYEVVELSGEREVLLDVPAYDFNWQTRYVLKEPRKLEAGSVIFCRAVFDNSDANPANPDPTKTVRWGDQSWDEMMLGYFDVLMPRDDSRKAGKKPVATGLDIVGKFDAADADHNGGLDTKEAVANEQLSKHFAAVDGNHDGLLQVGEIIMAVRAIEGGK